MPQLVDERLARLGEDVERVALPAAAVQGQHELGAQPLAQRVVGGERDQLGDDLGVVAELQVHVHERLDDADTPLDQAVALVLGVGADGAGQRLALEQGQRGPQGAGALGRFAGLAGGLGLLDAALEAGQVEGVLRQAQRVAAADRGEQLGAGAGGPVGFEHGAQPGDVRAQRAQGPRRGLLAPHRVDHLVRGDRVAFPQEQHAEDGTLQRGAQVEFLAITPRADRTEHGEPQPALNALTSHAVCLQANGTICYQMIDPSLLVT
ncbi:hypothetical protein GCM10020220_030570 [Nonomuraea rubra]